MFPTANVGILTGGGQLFDGGVFDKHVIWKLIKPKRKPIIKAYKWYQFIHRLRKPKNNDTKTLKIITGFSLICCYICERYNYDTNCSECECEEIQASSGKRWE